MYRYDIDALKGLAIIAVVFFHLGILKSGYLGVDAFFVINGFLVIPSVIKHIADNSFKYFNFLEKRIIRLLPLITIVSLISLALGYFLMLPDHYENLSQSVIASNCMSENVLSAITTKNYWDVSNDFKPLMHLWYVGILFEFYLILPLFMMFATKIANLLNQNSKKWMTCTLLLAAVVSLIMYLNPDVSIGDRFYFIQYRFFELCIGGLIGLIVGKLNWGGQTGLFASRVVSILLISIIFSSVYNILSGDNEHIRNVIGGANLTTTGMPFPATVSLLLTVLLSAAFVAFKDNGSLIFRSKVLIWLGSMSYSIFIWHQVLLAFYRYSVSTDVTLGFVIGFLIITLVISCVSYYFVEKKIATTHRSFVVWVSVAFFVILPSAYIYKHAGVVRDVPELNVIKGTEYRGMFAEYCDRVYNYNQDFPNNGKKNVLVVNISFGRDFANVLLESPYKDSINLSYVYLWRYPEALERAKQADYIFSFSSKEDIPSEVWNNIKETTKVYGIGTKNYGASNGFCYARRYRSDYHSMTNPLIAGYMDLNNAWKRSWGDNYIDFITPALCENGEIRIFTPDKKFIAQDCSHFTEAGAKWYASIIDWSRVFIDNE